MKCLVTGGAGFIGSNLVDGLIRDDHEVLIFDDLSTGLIENINPAANFIDADLYNADFINTNLSNANFVGANLDQANFEDIFICGKKLKGTFVYGSLFDTIGQLFEEDGDNEKSIIDVL